MSLSVERVKHMLDVAKKERQESWDDMDEIGRKFSDDCVSAFEELIAIKEEKPAMYALDFGNGPDADFCYRTEDEAVDGADGLSLIIGLIRKPE